MGTGLTKVINFYAGPGCGKSTSSAYCFAQLKQHGINSELVREYVKEWAWEGRKIGTYDQFYFLGKQIKKEAMVLGKVEIAITDSPVWLAAYYATTTSPPLLGLDACVAGYYAQAARDGHEHIHVWLNRSKPYEQAGRYHTEEQSRQVDRELKEFLRSRGVSLVECESDFTSLDHLLGGIVPTFGHPLARLNHGR